MNVHDDLVRLRREYERRARSPELDRRYSPLDPAQLFALQRRQRALVELLVQSGMASLAGRRILEIGCGSGGVLAEMVALGAVPDRVHGVDILVDRLREAHERLPGTSCVLADGRRLPYASGTFDVVLQFTALSSILADDVRRDVAIEMRRVVRPQGVILSYDFWLNPTNPHARGLRPAEIRRLFPGCRFEFRRISLAPPIARRVVHRSWLAAELLESLRLFNSHFLVAIRPEGER